MEANRKPYTREYKNDVVKMITGGGASAAQVAKDMDIDLKTIYQWIQEMTSRQEDVFPGKGRITSDAEIIRKLKRENAQLKTECEILKKTQEAFPKEP
jgi:transposase